MSNTDESISYYIPRTLDAPPKFLWWDYEVAIIAFSGLSLGIITDYLIPSLMVSCTMAYLFNKAKAGKRSGFSKHMVYWYLGVNIFKKRTPPSHLRDFIG